MQRSIAYTIGVKVSFLLTVGVAEAQSSRPSLRGLGFVGSTDSTRANSISADGTVVVGVSRRPAPLPEMPIRWNLLEEPVLEILDRPEGWTRGEAVATSGDGSVVLVSNRDLSQVRSYRWDAPGIATPLQELPSWLSVLGTFVTPNGEILGDVHVDDKGGRVARWSAMAPPALIPLPDQSSGARAASVDIHGRLFSEVAAPPATFVVQYDDDKPFRVWPLDYSARLAMISSHGTAAVGALGIGGDTGMWHMTLATSARVTVQPDSGLRWITPTAIAPDGLTVYGSQYPRNRSYAAPFVWTANAGKVATDVYFTARGLSLDGWSSLSVEDVSVDGSIFVGMGLNPEGKWEAMVITFPEGGCRADWNQDGAVSSQDFFDFLAGFFAGRADFNADALTNSQDFFEFLTSFFAGC